MRFPGVIGETRLLPEALADTCRKLKPLFQEGGISYA